MFDGDELRRGLRAGRPGTAALLAVALAFALALVLATAGAARADVYWGGVISGETYGEVGTAPTNTAAWSTFERHAGKTASIIDMSQPWGVVEESRLEAVRNRGAIPIVITSLPEGVSLEEVANGAQDATIRAWARQAKEWGHPFLFGPWWEMNGAWYHWGRDPNFVAAWRHFHDLVEQEGATNVTWVWIANAIWWDPESDPAPYYPGSAYVDWVGMDSYNWGFNPLQPDRWNSPEQAYGPTLERLNEIAPGKPVCICETASTEYGGNKADWIREVLDTYLPEHPAIKAYLYFNWNMEFDGGRRDWPIESSAPAQAAFRDGIQSSYYRAGAPAMAKLTKVPPPPGGSAQADAPADLSAGGGSASSPQIAAGPDESATAVWTRYDGSKYVVQSRRIAADGTPGPVEDLSASGHSGFQPQLAVAPDGSALVVWVDSDGSGFLVKGRRLAPDGTPAGAVIDLSTATQNEVDPQVAIGPDGTATVVWERTNVDWSGAYGKGTSYLIVERQVAADGTVGESHTLTPGGHSAVEPEVDVGPDSAPIVVWNRPDGSDSIVQARRVGVDGTPAEQTYDLSASGGSAIEPALDVGADGRARVAWTRFDGSHWVVQSRELSSTGEPAGAAHDLADAARDAVQPQLAVRPDDTGMVVWKRFDGDNWIVQLRRVGADAAPVGAAVDLSASGADAAEPALALAPDGGATVAWDRFDGSNWLVQRRRVGAGGGAESAAETLSAAGQSAGQPQAVVPGEVSETAVWRRFDGAFDIVQRATRYQPPQPPPESQQPPLAAGAAGAAGGAGGQAGPRKPGSRDGGTAGGAGKASRPSGFRLGRPHLDRRRGTALLPVILGGPGRLMVTGKGIKASGGLRAAGRNVLLVKPRGSARRQLRLEGALKVRLRVVFRPKSGSPSSRRLNLRLRQRHR
jgi:hypothetical protein